MSLTHCRFYEAKYPDIDELVMVNVKQIADMGAYVKLLEYDDIDGMVLLSELSRRRIRSVQKSVLGLARAFLPLLTFSSGSFASDEMRSSLY
jgi:hypothetical protein